MQCGKCINPACPEYGRIYGSAAPDLVARCSECGMGMEELGLASIEDRRYGTRPGFPSGIDAAGYCVSPGGGHFYNRPCDPGRQARHDPNERPGVDEPAVPCPKNALVRSLQGEHPRAARPRVLGKLSGVEGD